MAASQRNSINRHAFILCMILAVTLLHCEVVFCAERSTRIYGQVVDAQTGDPLSYVQIMFSGTQIGTVSDSSGYFDVSNSRGATTAVFRMLGYKTAHVSAGNHTELQVTVRMMPEAYDIEEIVVIPTSQHYSRRNNPAVELLKQVIAHKEQNRLDTASYTVSAYEKLTMSIDPFDFNLERNNFWRELKFLEKYVDTVYLSNQRRPFLPISIREQLRTESVTPDGSRSIIEAKTWAGMDKFFERGTLDANISSLFVPTDVRDNTLNLMQVQFISPLSSTQANAFYHYFILDTISIDGLQCIDLAFAPVNKQSLGFTGHLFIINDSTYALRRCRMSVTSAINLNWISGLRITQDFNRLPNGKWETSSVMMETNFALYRRMRHSIYARHLRLLNDYRLGASLPDSLFSMSGNTIIADSADNHNREYWDQHRPIPLDHSEEVCDAMADELRSRPRFQRWAKTLNILAEGYIPTSPDMTFENSYWDFGPIMSTVSYNGVEGWRVHIGGMTTAKAHPHWFFQGYVAYGFADKRPKGSGTVTYSFNPKTRYANEPLQHSLSLMGSYEVEVPGNQYGKLRRDNILFSFDPHSWADPNRWNRHALYVTRGRLTYEHEWRNRLDIKTHAEYERNEAGGDLHFSMPSNSIDKQLWHEDVLQAINWNISLTYSPGKPLYSKRTTNHNQLMQLNRRTPEFGISNQLGYILENQTIYNQTELFAKYRLWMSSFGYLDMHYRAGMVWGNKGIPYIKLFYPAANMSLIMTQNNFSMMRNMEFVMDKYITWHLTYHLNGLILNRIPFINRLRLREVVAFSGVYGHLADRNNPTISGSGLFALPNNTQPLSATMPYMELNVGLENIFHVLRIDYVRRLSYNDGLTGWQKNGIRITLRFEM